MKGGNWKIDLFGSDTLCFILLLKWKSEIKIKKVNFIVEPYAQCAKKMPVRLMMKKTFFTF